MAYESKPNTGVLFKNKKNKDTQPDYKGSGNVNGETVDIAGWIKKDKNGNPFLSLSFQEPRQRGDEPPF